jgi:hypothetical protein
MAEQLALGFGGLRQLRAEAAPGELQPSVCR